MRIKRNRFATLAGGLALAAAMVCTPTEAAAQGGTSKPTQAEYASISAAIAEKNAQQKVKLLDDFVAKYPNSDYMVYAYNEYLKAYSELKDWPKVIDCFDKKLTMPNLDNPNRLQALYGRAQTYELAVKTTDANLTAEATKGRDAALAGLKALDTAEKPAGATDEQFATAKKQIAVQFYNVAALASTHLKDYKAAADNYAKSAQLDEQAVTDYRLAVADLMETPPASIDGFWELARALDLKLPDADKITKFLRDRMSDYQAPVCDPAVDAELKDLLAQAQNPSTHSTYSLPSAADIGKARDRDAAAIIADLRAGGDKGKLTWLAVCNGVFPETFIGKTYDANAADPAAIALQVAVGSTQEEVDASTAADTVLKITAQPEAARLSKDDSFRFAGKLTGYAQTPFQLTFEDVKINPEDIPAEKGKAVPKKAGKKPSVK